jgi:hypothetical protein
MLSVKLKNDIQPGIRAEGEPMEQNPLVLFYRVEDKTAIMLRYRLVKIIMIRTHNSDDKFSKKVHTL